MLSRGPRHFVECTPHLSGVHSVREIFGLGVYGTNRFLLLCVHFDHVQKEHMVKRLLYNATDSRSIPAKGSLFFASPTSTPYHRQRKLDFLQVMLAHSAATSVRTLKLQYKNLFSKRCVQNAAE